MPCRDWLEKETSAADERIKHLKTDMDKIRNKMNLLTRLLCEAGTIINGAHVNQAKRAIRWKPVLFKRQNV